MITIVWASVVCQQCLACGCSIFVLSVLSRTYRSPTSTQHKQKTQQALGTAAVKTSSSVAGAHPLVHWGKHPQGLGDADASSETCHACTHTRTRAQAQEQDATCNSGRRAAFANWLWAGPPTVWEVISVVAFGVRTKLLSDLPTVTPQSVGAVVGSV